MKSEEIKHNVQNLIDNFSKKEFVFDLLEAYGISKTSITRLKKGDFNLSKIEEEILYKKKIFYKVESSDKLLSSIEEITKEERILKYKPRFAIFTDYKQLVAKDLKLGKNLDIKLKELPNYFDFFLPLAGSEVYNAKNDNEADRNASYKMATLYDELKSANPHIYNSKESIHNLNIFLSRLLFCFFAEDTEIFGQESIFTKTLVQHTTKNGKDTHLFLDDLFDRLNSEKGKNYPDFLAKFPYVNGGLFNQKINAPKFNTKSRKILIDLGGLNWSEINPDIFGSMIQAVVIPDYRSDLGMHYTSVTNILKLIKSLFLDELYSEFENVKTIKQLRTLIRRIANIKFFDPACGSGNFLIIAYKEIRLLEINILEKIIDLETAPAFEFTHIKLSQFYGIEIDDFAHEMAILSLWLAEHQMNLVFEDRLGGYGKSKSILPLKETGQIQQGNATRLDWKTICPITKNDEVYIIGNPPYLGSSMQDTIQKSDMSVVFNKFTLYKNLDYIAIWFKKGVDYLKNKNARLAFVTTNSITQGEQVSLLWPYIISREIEIDFAYQSFKWNNNAKGNAGVTVVIIGLRNLNSKKEKYLFIGKLKQSVFNISPYLTIANNIILGRHTISISCLPDLVRGSMPTDGGNFTLTVEEKDRLILTNPEASKFIKKMLSGGDYLNRNERYCLWIEDEDIELAKSIPLIKARLEAIEIFRLNSKAPSTVEYAKFPNRFRQRAFKNTESIIVPLTSSEKRTYIPFDFLSPDVVVTNSAGVIYDAKPWHFGVISSKMHMAWVSVVAGKLKTDYRYSSTLCYNTFPFPEITIKQKENLKLYVFVILDERAKHPSKTMAQLYNPDTMPRGLLQAHQKLDTAIEQCYRLQPFKNDTERLEYLFKQYEKMVKEDTIFANQKKKRQNR